ncbi:MAG TPA: CPBP family intramembrane glutamic endopeptidase [Planktothrix sp.]
MSGYAVRLKESLFHPNIRLKNDFPLAGKQLGKVYTKALVYFTLGSAMPILLVLGAMMLLPYLPYSISDPAISIMNRCFPGDKPSATFLVAMALISFITGALLELAVLVGALKNQGKTFCQAVSLNLDALKGSSRWQTAFNFAWRVFVAVTLWAVLDIALGMLLPSGHQASLDYTKMMAGGNLWIWFAIAAIGAPLTEEIVFRGFLFSALRRSFGQGRIAHWLGDGRYADVAAVVASSLVFTLMHFQFDWAAVQIFLAGCFLAELYRRSGTLWTGIVCHACNNGFTVLFLAMSSHH